MSDGQAQRAIPATGRWPVNPDDLPRAAEEVCQGHPECVLYDEHPLHHQDMTGRAWLDGVDPDAADPQGHLVDVRLRVIGSPQDCRAVLAAIASVVDMGEPSEERPSYQHRDRVRQYADVRAVKPNAGEG